MASAFHFHQNRALFFHDNTLAIKYLHFCNPVHCKFWDYIGSKNLVIRKGFHWFYFINKFVEVLVYEI